MFEKREKVLVCFLPFSRCDGSMPFIRVFVSKEKVKDETAISEAQSGPVVKVKDIPELQRLYTSTESGYL